MRRIIITPTSGQWTLTVREDASPEAVFPTREQAEEYGRRLTLKGGILIVRDEAGSPIYLEARDQ